LESLTGGNRAQYAEINQLKTRRLEKFELRGFETLIFLEVQTMHTIGKATSAVLAAVFAIAMTTFSSLAASDFEGVWKVTDTAGQPFEITLSGGGAAKASRGEGMVGTWKEEGKTAVITWNTGWTTKIAKEGDQYKKTAYGKASRWTVQRPTAQTRKR
jgi:hypothetical protein